MKLIVIFIRPLILFNHLNKISTQKSSNLILVILIAGLLPSVLFFDIVLIVDFFDNLLAYTDLANFEIISLTLQLNKFI